MRVHVLGNPAGGRKASNSRANEVLARLTHKGHSVVDLTGSCAQDSTANLAHAVGTGAIEHVVLAGGDGLIHLAIQHLAQTAIPISIVPTGTGNDFAKALGILPIDELDIRAPQKDIDLLEAHLSTETRWVASIAIAGFPAAINKRANSISLPIGAQIYPVSAILEMPNFSRLRVALRLDGEPIETDTAMLAIGNTRFFGGGMLACPDATPTDGRAHLTSIEGVGRLGLMPHLIKRTGGSANRPEVLRRTCQRVEIRTPGIDVWGDGERLGESPMTLRIVPGALRIAGAHTI